MACIRVDPSDQTTETTEGIEDYDYDVDYDYEYDQAE